MLRAPAAAWMRAASTMPRSRRRRSSRTVRVTDDRLTTAVDRDPALGPVAHDRDERRDPARFARARAVRVGAPPWERRGEDARVALRDLEPEAVRALDLGERVAQDGLRDSRPNAAEIFAVHARGDRHRMQV